MPLSPLCHFLPSPTLRTFEILSTCETLHSGCTLPATASTAATAACAQLVSQPTRNPVADDDCELAKENTAEALSAAGGHTVHTFQSS